MSGDVINICICVPFEPVGPSAEQVAAAERRLLALDPRLRVHYQPYLDSPRIRALRGQPGGERAREEVEPPSPALRDALARAEVVLAVDLPFDMHLLAPNLRWVQSIGAGVGQLQNCGLAQLGALLTSGAGIAAPSIAEFVLARILAHWKLFSLYQEMQSERRWVPTNGRSLAGSTLGIVGLGAIGTQLARRAKALGMHVLATRRRFDPDNCDPAVDQLLPAGELKTLLQRADAVVLCAAESAETFHLFDADAFAAMRPGSYFCNVSRGSLVDEPALCAALASGQLSGAGIDVAAVEPLPPESPLWDAPNLQISPHSAASLEHFFDRAWELFNDNMRRYLAGEPLRNICSTRP